MSKRRVRKEGRKDRVARKVKKEEKEGEYNYKGRRINRNEKGDRKEKEKIRLSIKFG